MALLTWKRLTAADSDELAEAQSYAIPRITAGMCLLDDVELNITRLGGYLDDHPTAIWITGRDDGRLVAVYVAEPADPPYVLKNIGAVFAPSYSAPEMIENIAIARHRLIPCEPGDATLSFAFPGPALEVLRATFTGPGDVEDYPQGPVPGLVKVTMYRPDVIPEHYDVPRLAV